MFHHSCHSLIRCNICCGKISKKKPFRNKCKWLHLLLEFYKNGSQYARRGRARNFPVLPNRYMHFHFRSSTLREWVNGYTMVWRTNCRQAYIKHINICYQTFDFPLVWPTKRRPRNQAKWNFFNETEFSSDFLHSFHYCYISTRCRVIVVCFWKAFRCGCYHGHTSNLGCMHREGDIENGLRLIYIGYYSGVDLFWIVAAKYTFSWWNYNANEPTSLIISESIYLSYLQYLPTRSMHLRLLAATNWSATAKEPTLAHIFYTGIAIIFRPLSIFPLLLFYLFLVFIVIANVITGSVLWMCINGWVWVFMQICRCRIYMK